MRERTEVRHRTSMQALFAPAVDRRARRLPEQLFADQMCDPVPAAIPRGMRFAIRQTHDGKRTCRCERCEPAGHHRRAANVVQLCGRHAHRAVHDEVGIRGHRREIGKQAVEHFGEIAPEFLHETQQPNARTIRKPRPRAWRRQHADRIAVQRAK